MRSLLILTVALGSVLLVACKKPAETTEPSTPTTQEVAKEAEQEAQAVVEADQAPAEGGETTPAEPQKTEQDPNSAEAKAGEDQQY